MCITNVNADPTNTVPFLEKALSLVSCVTEYAGVPLGLTKLQAPWSQAKLTKFNRVKRSSKVPFGEEVL